MKLTLIHCMNAVFIIFRTKMVVAEDILGDLPEVACVYDE